ncbi:MAG: 2-phospho-L-lactate guanylyltransferase [Chloroflexi bacterium]|nr:MAG: 2-phospho-L-lactate guanylyltransferase [Chloroflexota bacterium]
MAHPLQLWITIPAKPLAEGKSRLALALGADERLALTRQLVQRTLDVVLSVAGVAGVIVISRDPEVLGLADRCGALAVAERSANGREKKDEQEWGLNRAIEQAAAFVQTRGGDALLFLPTDLPLLQAAEVALLLRVWDQRHNCVVIAPSQSGGTNALLLCPPNAIASAFGLGSFARHLQLAQQRGLHVEVVESPVLAWDVDTPDEYRLLVAQ